MDSPEHSSRIDHSRNANPPTLHLRRSHLDPILGREVEGDNMIPPGVQIGHGQVDHEIIGHSLT